MGDYMGQYFSNDDLKSEIKTYKTKIFDKEFCFNTDNGVFSKSKLDFGTRTLLENLPLDKLHGSVLEIGCGYGVVPIILSKVCNAESFEGVDVNKRAIYLANINSKQNKCVGVTFYESNCYESVNKKYNFIITNPPIRAGKKIVYEIVMNAKDYLLDKGELYIVINKDQGAKSLVKDLSRVYVVDVIAKNKGFWVIKCILH